MPSALPKADQNTPLIDKPERFSVLPHAASRLVGQIAAPRKDTGRDPLQSRKDLKEQMQWWAERETAQAQQQVASQEAIVQIAPFFSSDGKLTYHASGSGVVAYRHGTIITNSHVIRQLQRGDSGCDFPKDRPLASLLVILIQDPQKLAEPPVPKYAVDLRGLTGEAFARALPAEDSSLDLAVIRINKRIIGKEPPKNLEELRKAVEMNTLELADLDKPLDLKSLPLWDVAAVEEGQDVQLGGYPVVSPLPRLTFTEGLVLEKRAEGTLLVERAFATFGFSGGALVEKRSGFLVGILCGGQAIETPAGPLVLAVGRALDTQAQELLNKVPEVKRRPVPRFTFSPGFSKPGDIVTLDASTSFDPDGRITKCEWDLDGDGKPDAEGVQIQQAFQDDIRVTLRVTDSDGLRAKRSRRVILDRREQLRREQRQCKPIQIGNRTFDTIREAINAAQAGDIITVGPGTCQENLKITKSLTLQGAGRDQTILLGDGRAPVIAVCPRKPTGESACPQPVEVTIEGFTIRNGWHALQALANAKVIVREGDLLESVQQGVDAAFGADVTLVNNHISLNGEEGFVLEGGRAELRGNTIAENGDDGVLIKNLRTFDRIIEADAKLKENTIKSNKSFGVFITQQAKAQIQGGRISRSRSSGVKADEQADLKVIGTEILKENAWGIYLFDASAEIMENTVISDNKWIGLVVGGSAQVTITNAQFSGNGYDGIEILDSAQAIITGSAIVGNGTDEDCEKEDSLCNGIFVCEKSWVKVIGSRILNNADWGVGAYLKQCGSGRDDFTGKVVFKDMMLDRIAGNNTSGNQKGMGNPGNHPWNRPGVPDGQVCLP